MSRTATAYPTYAAAYTALGPVRIGHLCGMSEAWAKHLGRGRRLPSLEAAFLLEERLGIPVHSWRGEHRLERRVA
jgi:hypothetical protein